MHKLWVFVLGRKFMMNVPSIHPSHVEQIGGPLVSISMEANSSLWKVKSVDEAFELLQGNFPQMRMRDAFSQETMERFVNGNCILIPLVSRIASLVGFVGKHSSGGGVVILGDAAHSFPPDFGQGLNSGLEDVNEFISILENGAQNSKLHDLLALFERGRMDDILGLVEICSFNSHLGERRPLHRIVGIIDMKLRTLLSVWFPQWFYPGVVAMLSKGWSYGLIRRRFRVTTKRIFVLLGLLTFFAFFCAVFCVPLIQRKSHRSSTTGAGA